MPQAKTVSDNGSAYELLEMLSRIGSDLEAMRSKIAQLQSELNAEKSKTELLRAEKTELERLCTQYSKSILAMMPPSEPFTQEEIDDLMANGVKSDGLRALLEELKGA